MAELNVPDELMRLFNRTWANHEGADSTADRAALAAVLERHEQMVLERASEKLMALAEEYAGSPTGPRARWRRALHAAARHILPPLTPEQLADAIADGSAVVMGCPSLDEEIARGGPDA